MDEIKLCECGCGQPTRKGRGGKWNRFIVGHNPKMLGKKLSEEHKRKISESEKGKKVSEETREKLRQVNLGKVIPEEVRQKISKSLKGRPSPMKGRKLSDKTKKQISDSLKARWEADGHPSCGRIPWNKGKKNCFNNDVLEIMSKAKKGKPLSEEHRKNLSKAGKGRVFSEEHKRKISEAKVGKPRSEEVRRRMSESMKGKFSGEKNPNWRGGVSFKPYSSSWTESLKIKIRERDNYICQNCGKFGNIIHHIDYNKENCSEDNLITMCNRCNSTANFDREYWQLHFSLIQKLNGI